jgi:release factor glutamine methyltransferase
MIVANLPYIKDREFKDLSPDIMNFEPISALAGGVDGLDKIQLMLREMPGRLNCGGHLLLEIGKGQRRQVVSLIEDLFPKASIQLISDLGGIERVVKVEL